MKKIILSSLALLLVSVISPRAVGAEQTNTLSGEEKSDGWRLLFDGLSTQGWRNFKKTSFPNKGWVVEDGWLKKTAGVQGGDIITDETFGDFELQWEWRLAAKANSGIKYFITEERSGAIGHEYQMWDGPEGKVDKHCTASFYDVLPPTTAPEQKPVGEVNHSRVVVRGNHVEHWLNGTKVLSYELGGAEVMAAVAMSKFKSVPDFGTKIKGHILLTDHNDEAWFRNVKIRAAKP